VSGTGKKTDVRDFISVERGRLVCGWIFERLRGSQERAGKTGNIGNTGGGTLSVRRELCRLSGCCTFCNNLIWFPHFSLRPLIRTGR
jgi:hypothetical protein